MIWPSEDDWRLKYLQNLLDENALELTTGLNEVRKRRVRAVRDFARLPDAPHLGPTTLADLHQESAARARDPEWLQAHQLAVHYYRARAEQLCSKLTEKIDRTVLDPPNEARQLVATAIALWEDSGRDLPSSEVLLDLAPRLQGEETRDLGEGIAHIIEEYFAGPEVLDCLGAQERTRALFLAAKAAEELGNRTEVRRLEFFDRALYHLVAATATLPTERRPDGIRRMQILVEAAVRTVDPTNPGTADRYRSVVEACASDGEDGGLAALMNLRVPDDRTIAETRRIGLQLARRAIFLRTRILDSRSLHRDLLDAEVQDILLRWVRGSILAPPWARPDADSVAAQARVALTPVPADYIHPQWVVDVDRALSLVVRGSTLEVGSLDSYLERAARWQPDEGHREAGAAETKAAIELIDRAAADAVPYWLLQLLVVKGHAALGVRFLGDVCRHADRKGLDQPHRQQCCLVALDELAAIAASTSPQERGATRPTIPSSIHKRARQELIELAGHPELTTLALERLPFHRLDSTDAGRLRTLLNQRLEIFQEGLVDDIDDWRTQCVELAFLRALDRVNGSSWWTKSPRGRDPGP